MTHALSGTEYLKREGPEELWVVEGVLPVGGALNIMGAPKAGKTYHTFQLACAIAEGWPEWMGFPIHTHGPVLYLQLDTPPGLWRERYIRPAEKYHSWNLDNVYILDKQMTPFPFDVMNLDHAKWLKNEVEAIHPVLTIIDTIRECHSGDENDNRTMKNVMASLVSVTMPGGVCVVSHTKKPQKDVESTLVTEGRGSNYVPGRMDTIMRATKKELAWVGRALEEGKARMKRYPTGFWQLDDAEVHQHALAVLQEMPNAPIHAMAKALAGKAKIDEEAARSRLRRMMNKGMHL